MKPTPSLEPQQIEFMRRCERNSTAFERNGLWLGDLLYRGLVRPVSEFAWEFYLTDAGKRALSEVSK